MKQKRWRRGLGDCLMMHKIKWSGDAILGWGEYHREQLLDQSCDRVPGRVWSVQTVVNYTSVWISAGQIVGADRATLMRSEENNIYLFLPWIESLSVSVWVFLSELWFNLFSLFFLMGCTPGFYINFLSFSISPSTTQLLSHISIISPLITLFPIFPLVGRRTEVI